MKNKIKLIIITIMFLISFVFLNFLYNLNILPNKYIYLISIIIILINIIGLLLIFIKGKLNKILCGIVYGFLTIVSILGIKYSNSTINFLKNGFNSLEYDTYNIIVLNKKYNNLSDLNNSNMGYLFLDKETEYLKKINIDVNLKKLGLNELHDELVNGEIDSIIISDGVVSLLENEYENFNEIFKILDTIKVEKEIENTEYNELKTVNIFLSGSDSRSKKLPYSTLSDVNMIVTINPKEHKVLLTSIPRDYYVQLHGTKGYKDKLTHAGVYGIDMSINTIEDFMNIEIDYYIKVGFQSVIKLVDLVGGVDIYSDSSFKTLCNDGGAESVYVKKGINHFTGAQALSYARERYAYNTGDIHRVQNQQQIIEAVANKIVTNKSILLKYDTILNSFSELYKTNIQNEFVTLLIKEQLENIEKWNIEKQTLTGYGSSNYTYSMPNQKLYVMVPDNNSINNAVNKIKEYYN